MIIGIDPGLVTTGWGIVKKTSDNKVLYVDSGCIKTSSSQNIDCRLLTLHEGLQEVITQHPIVACAIEDTFMNKNPGSSLKLGRASGALILSAKIHHIPIHFYAANLIKKTIVGVGHADKKQVFSMLKCLLSNSDHMHEKKYDASDALAVALCHVYHHKAKRLIC